MKILIPHLDDSNTYVPQLADAVRSLGQEAMRLPLDRGMAQGPDVLWIHWPELLGLGVPPTQTALVSFNDLLTRFTRRGVVAWTVHNLVPHAYPNHPAFRCLYEIVSAHAQVQIHHGRASVALAHALYPRPKTCVTKVVHHGGYWNLLGHHTSASARQTLQLPRDKRILLAFGSLRSAAELDLILTAAGTGWHVVMAGRLPRIPRHLRPIYWLQRQRAKPNLTHIRGHIPDADVDPIVKACDAVLIARHHALNSGNVYLAMTFGKALIGPNEGNTGEILALTENLRFDAGDPASLQPVLRQALAADLASLGTRNAEWLKANAQWELIAASLLEAVSGLQNHARSGACSSAGWNHANPL